MVDRTVLGILDYLVGCDSTTDEIVREFGADGDREGFVGLLQEMEEEGLLRPGGLAATWEVTKAGARLVANTEPAQVTEESKEAIRRLDAYIESQRS